MNFVIKLYKYTEERFPLYQYLMLAIILSLPVFIMIGMYYENTAANIFYLFITVIALLLFLFRLRLFDEFKDYQHDTLYYPERPVPRGLVSLKELKFLLIPIIIIEITISLMGGVITFGAFLIAFLYSLLMFKEFFISTWLRKNFTIYILTHEILIIPLFVYLFYINSMPARAIFGIFPWLLLFFLGSQIFLLEITRKIRPKEMEVSSADTYTAQYGIWGASILCIFLALIPLISGYYMLESITHNIVLYLPSLFLFILFVVFLGLFSFNPTAKKAKNVFLSSIIFVFAQCIFLSLAFYL